jgi:hypothetical protein
MENSFRGTDAGCARFCRTEPPRYESTEDALGYILDSSFGKIDPKSLRAEPGRSVVPPSTVVRAAG